MGGEKFGIETLARIDGHRAAMGESPAARIRVLLPMLIGLSEENLSRFDQKSIAAKSKQVDDLSSTISEATTYVALCRRFMSRRNWLGFAAAFGQEKLKTNPRGQRILHQLVDMATE
ncbi:MAG: hypothetical protein KIT60_20590 [Burkholderiaceae bacterium]|nr:hypothetical protein [Burkholderiaceae bacterium]